jgi:hypothetical protein
VGKVRAELCKLAEARHCVLLLLLVVVVGEFVACLAAAAADNGRAEEEEGEFGRARVLELGASPQNSS